MKRLIVILLCCSQLFSRSIAMAACSSVAYRVGPYNICGASHGAAVASHITETYSPTAGNGVLLLLSYRPEVAVTSIVDQAANAISCFVASPSAPGDLVASDGDDERFTSYYCPSIPSGITSIQQNMSTTLIFGHTILVEIDSSNMVANSTWDTDTYNVTTAQTQVYPVSVTNAYARDLIVAHMHNGNATFPPGGYPDVTGDANYTTITSTPGYPPNFNIQMRAVNASQQQTATITWGTHDYNGFGFVGGLKGNPRQDILSQGSGSAKTTSGTGSSKGTP